MVIMNLFRAGEMVMLQNALAVATVICVMALTRVVHPPAGALCLVVLGAYNHGATHEKVTGRSAYGAEVAYVTEAMLLSEARRLLIFFFLFEE